MELRKCTCGGKPFLSKMAQRCYVICEKCAKSTQNYKTERGAIQAWNEGKVE